MSLRVRAKRWIERTPRSVGRVLVSIPHSARLGPAYGASKREIRDFKAFSDDALRAAIVRRVERAVRTAARTNPFYRSLYASRGGSVPSVRSLADVRRLPIVTRQDLQAVPLEARSRPVAGRLRVNTGGTSGQPLAFYLDRNAFAREWAHMHDVWGRLGYRPEDLKLTLRGSNLGPRAIRYNAVHNEFLVNSYVPMQERLEAIANIAGSLAYLHGYPSLVYEFVRRCREEAPRVLRALRGALRGVLFGSEYPAPVYRDLVERELGVPTISWYGHSEFTILAVETERYVYEPYPSYGYCEAVPAEAGSGAYRLIGTAYHNQASPFLRYDTGDLVHPEIEDGLLRRFRVAEGRIGDFVVDRHGERIGLTALVFGRHHAVFDVARFVQVRQDRPGEVCFLIAVGGTDRHDEADLRRGLDLSGVALDVRVEMVREPVRTAAGKVPLLVPHAHPSGGAPASASGDRS